MLLEDIGVGFLKPEHIPIAYCDMSSLYQPGAILDSQTTDSQWADNLGGSLTQDPTLIIKEDVDESEAEAEGIFYLHYFIYLD